MRHLTWRGRLSWVYYRVREVFVAPAPAMERCFMGAPIGPDAQCPRYAAAGLWCKHHAPAARLLEKDSDQ